MFVSGKRKQAKRYKSKFGFLTIREIAFKLGVTYDSLYQSFRREGLEVAIQKAETKDRKFYIYRGEKMSACKLSAKAKVSCSWIYKKFNSGDDVTEAVDKFISEREEFEVDKPSSATVNRSHKRSRIIETREYIASCSGRVNAK